MNWELEFRLLDVKLVDALDDARVLREDADYRTDFSEVGARHGLEHARQWLEQVDRLLQIWKETSNENADQAHPAG